MSMKKLLLVLLLACPISAQAANSFIASSTSEDSAAQSRTLTEPTGTAQNDDVFVFCVASVTTAITWTDPADFTEIDQGQVALGATPLNYYLGRKRRGATAGDALTFSHADTANRIRCTAATFRGVDGSSPLDVAFSEANHLEVGAVNVPNMAAEDITTVTNGAWVVLFYGASGTISGAAGPPAGYTLVADHLTSSPTDRITYIVRKEVATAGLETPGVFTHTDDDVNPDPDPFTITLALRPATASAPVLSSTNVTPIANGYLVAGTCTGTGTLTAEAVGCALGDAAPSSNELEAGQCGGGNAAILNQSETWTTGVANDFNLATAGKPPKLNVYLGCTNGTDDATVDAHANELRSADSGQEIVTIASHSSTGHCNQDAHFNPDCDDGDVWEHDAVSNETVGSCTPGVDCCLINISAAGEIEWAPEAPGVCDGSISFEISYENDDSATDGCMTAPTGACFATDETIFNNNEPPVCTQEPTSTIQLQKEDTAMQDRDLADIGGCTDPEGDQLTATIVGGSLPAGSAQSGTGNLTWGGTPNTENEAGTEITVRVTDIATNFDEYTFTNYVVNTFAAPDCGGLPASECADAMLLAAPWRAFDVGVGISALLCEAGVAGVVTDQDPAAAAAMEPLEQLDISLTRRCGGKIPFGFGITSP